MIRDRMPTIGAVLAEIAPDKIQQTPTSALVSWLQRLARAIDRDRALAPVILFSAVRQPVLVLAKAEWRYDVVARRSLFLCLKGRGLKLTDTKGRPLTSRALLAAHGEEIDRGEFDLLYHRAEAFRLAPDAG